MANSKRMECANCRVSFAYEGVQHSRRNFCCLACFLKWREWERHFEEAAASYCGYCLRPEWNCIC